MVEDQDQPFRFSMPAAPEGHFLAAPEAERQLQARVREALPGSAEHHAARFELLRFLGLVGRMPEAFHELESLLETDADDEDKAAWTMVVGTCVERVGDFPAAIGFYELALDFEPAGPETAYFAHNNLAYSANQTGDFAKGEVQARAAIVVDDARHNAHKNLGVALAGLGRASEAARAYVAAVHREASDPRALAHLEALIARHPELPLGDPGLGEELERCRAAVATARAIRDGGEQN